MYCPIGVVTYKAPGPVASKILSGAISRYWSAGHVVITATAHWASHARHPRLHQKLGHAAAASPRRTALAPVQQGRSRLPRRLRLRPRRAPRRPADPPVPPALLPLGP